VSLSESGNTAGETFTVTLSDSFGNLSATGAGVSGSGTATLTISGSLSQVNSDLGTLTDTDSKTPSDKITVTAADSFGNSAAQQMIAVKVNSAPLSNALLASSALDAPSYSITSQPSPVLASTFGSFFETITVPGAGAIKRDMFTANLDLLNQYANGYSGSTTAYTLPTDHHNGFHSGALLQLAVHNV
jgi:hypothetical protein